MAGLTERLALTVRISPAAMEVLAQLQKIYSDRVGLPDKLSQSDAVEVGLRELAGVHKIKLNNSKKHT